MHLFLKIEGKEEWNLNPSMRLKVKGDMFFLPMQDGGVYFRNNVGSFRMEGSSINQWIEKLMPMFTGEYTMGDLTNGLPEPYRERVYEIASVLVANGYVRNVSEDQPHQLPDSILQRYASQIEFLDSFGGSGAYRFQQYRQAKVLVIGSGSFLLSLMKCLLESGMPKFHVLITDAVSTNRERLTELVQHARQMDSEVEVEVEETCMSQSEEGVDWRKAVQPFQSILYVSQESDSFEWRTIHAICREEKKLLLPTMYLGQRGVAGPLIHPEWEGCWESARRRIHQAALCSDREQHVRSSTSDAMLANVVVFQWFKAAVEVLVPELRNSLFLLDLETLEGGWHRFYPHPLVHGSLAAERIEDLESLLLQSPIEKESDGILHYFNQLTSMETGIFHVWDEGELTQLPLAQCLVQPVSPLSDGPAELLPAIVCNALKHDEARREAGLAGLEKYVSQMADQLVRSTSAHSEAVSTTNLFVGVGAGVTASEGISRGLQKCLAEELRTQLAESKPSIKYLQLSAVEDKQCHYYLTVLTTMLGAPLIGLGNKLMGFPVVWIGINGGWHGSVGLNLTLALRKALQQALLEAQNKEIFQQEQALRISSVSLEAETPQNMLISAYEDSDHRLALQSALQILKENDKQISVYNLACESFLKEELAGVFGVSLGEEESA
ncbi:putative thiazole-containing bacteriocin maturation protein [Paenibacillus castaneae]|nr:putative thiazole-containing bacteriocin maturation protein [Paenibacillus castaneae]